MYCCLVAEFPASDGPLHVLWYRQGSDVRVLPWGSRDRRDIQAVGRSLVELGSPFGDPRTQAEVIVAGALRHANGRRLALVDLDEAERDTVERTVAWSLREDGHVDAGSTAASVIETEVVELVGQRLAASTV